MNEHADYYLARVPEPTTLLGLRLRPFSLGHLLLLHRTGSYFVGASDAVTYDDLAVSVLICSQTYAGALAHFDDPDRLRFMAKWADRLTGRGFLSAIGLRSLRTIDLQAKASQFLAYMDAGQRKLTYAIKEEGTALPLPLVQIVRVTLLKEFGALTDEAIMDRPWGLCLEDFITLRAIEGTVTMYDGSILDEAREAAKAYHDKLVARGEIKPQPNGAH